MTRRKIVIALACVAGAALTIGPIVAQYRHPGSNTHVEKAFARYVQRTRHRGARDVRCMTNSSLARGSYLCFFRYAGLNPVAIPKFLCVRVVAGEARRATCFTPA